jgi:hypothetical protein
MSEGPKGSIFRWETVKKLGPDVLRFAEAVFGVEVEVELVSGSRIRAFCAEDGVFYFCHGLTFGGIEAPAGALSPYSGRSVTTILNDCYIRVNPEVNAVVGDVAIWYDLDNRPTHSAILVTPFVGEGKDRLEYASVFRSKNGNLPERHLTLQGYGESYAIFRRK